MDREGSGGIQVVSAGRVHTMNGTVAEAFAVFGSRILAAGSRKGLLDRFPGAHDVGLGAHSVVVPGFNDAHMHPSLIAEERLHLDLGYPRVSSKADLIHAIQAHGGGRSAGQWLRGFGYDPAKSTPGEVIDRDFLDTHCPDVPALVIEVSCHWGIANSRALRLAGWSEESEDPPGGSLGRDGSGNLNGIVYEQALFDLAYAALARGRTVIPESSLEDRLLSLKQVLREFHAAGITSVGDALAYPGAIELYQEAERRRELTMRVGMLIAYPHFDSLRDLRIQPGFGSDFLRINGLKAFVDGAVGGRTCLLEEPFEGSDDHGQQVISPDALDELALAAQKAGMRLAVHANGDRALGLLLDSLEKAALEVPRPDIRHRIEHCTLINLEILERMRRLDVIAVPFGSYVVTHGEKLLEWYGAERLERMFPHRSLLDAGITVAGSSDYTCAPFEPLLGIQSCVTRQTLNGLPLGTSQRITPYEALWIYTVGSATATGEAQVKGRIAPGYLADFTVLGADPLEVDSSDIASIPVLDTWIGGRTVLEDL